MKFFAKPLFILLFLMACGRPNEQATDKAKPDSLNKVLYNQVMEIHDEVMPGMEKIYKLKQDIESQIASTPNLSKKRAQQLEETVTNLDSANNSMLIWMQKFNPLPDSADVLKARSYLETELERVKLVRTNINESIAKAEAELLKSTASKEKKATKSISKAGNEVQPLPVVEEKPAVKEVSEESIVYEPIPTELPRKDSTASKPVVANLDSAKKSVTKPVDKAPEGKPFYFKLTNADTGAPVVGEVHILEARATQYQGFHGNELIYLKPPKNVAGMYQVMISAPGYKPVALIFNYKDTEPIATGTGDKQEVIVAFELIRAKKGDYIDFNEVLFFRNTVILESQSRNELNGLVSLLKEGAYKIRIHGHCNGDDPRNVTTLGTSTNFFALEPGHNKREMLTAKRLTELRAEIVKNYLVSQGIEGDRIFTKGEGGKMMIYPRTSTLANRNDRVEVEVLKSK